MSNGKTDVAGNVFSCSSPHVLSNLTLNLTNRILNDPYPLARQGVGPSRLNSRPIENSVELPTLIAILACTIARKRKGENWINTSNPKSPTALNLETLNVKSMDAPN